MGLVLLSGGGSPVTTDQMTTHLRLDGLPVQTDLLQSYIDAATEYVQNLTGQQLLPAVMKLTFDHFPRERHIFGREFFWRYAWMDYPLRTIRLPIYPVASVSAIKYVAPDGSNPTLDSSTYFSDVSGGIARIGLMPGNDWPETMARIGAAEIDFAAGYGTSDDVPPLLIQAIKLLAAHWYENREAASDADLSEIPLAVRSIIDQHYFQGA